jgi:hypothetical protein
VRTASQKSIEHSQGQSRNLSGHYFFLLLHCSPTCCPACENNPLPRPKSHHHQPIRPSPTALPLKTPDHTHVTYESIRTSQSQRKPAVPQHQGRLRAR